MSNRVTNLNILPSFAGWEPLPSDEPMRKDDSLVHIDSSPTFLTNNKNPNTSGATGALFEGRSYNQVVSVGNTQGASINLAYYPYRRVAEKQGLNMDHPLLKFLNPAMVCLVPELRPVHPDEKIENGDLWIYYPSGIKKEASTSVGIMLSKYLDDSFKASFTEGGGYLSAWPFRHKDKGVAKPANVRRPRLETPAHLVQPYPLP